MSKQFQLCSVPYSKSLGSFFKLARSMAGITQNELAQKLDLKSSQFISNVERGICAYTLEQLPIVIATCKIQPEDLIEAFMKEYQDYLEVHIG